eukprot:TRINITY_DN19282_c0_g1_i6.p1 TRINITY_DN19282_c0_g1~~TRINITY_DN19282_c0_g1_i6.p1  ORF type:complete len:672 (+),score=180.90 TRINITY_DN19282_c0_g1_i6:105-2120(+)
MLRSLVGSEMCIRDRCDDTRNTVVVMSGRERAVLDGFIGMLPVWLVAENGLFYRFGGREMEWQSLEDEPFDTSWTDSVKPVFKYFEERTPNAFLEVQETSITWHYREAEEEFAELQASDLTMHVEKVLSNTPVEVIMHNHKVEVRPHGISKGDMLDVLLEEMGYHQEDLEIEFPTEAEASDPPLKLTSDERRKQRLLSYLDRKKLTAEESRRAAAEEMLSPTGSSNVSDVEPLDFVMCMGNFSSRDEDLFTNLRSEDYDYRSKLAPLDRTYVIKVNHTHTTADYSVRSFDEVEPFLSALANVARSTEGFLSANVSDSEADFDLPQGPGVLRNALDSFDQIRAFCRNKQVAFFLDYDGTLTPIVSSPELATLSEEAREVVRRLAQMYPTAIVTGRTKATAHGFVQIDDLWYAGSHGFDIGRGATDSENFGYSVASSYQPALLDAQQVLQKMLAEIGGMLIEDNTFSISVHYRNVSESDRPLVEAAVQEVLSTRPMLRMTNGKMVYELRPSVDWHKGKAVEWLLHVIRQDYPGTEIVPIYIGDDVTDEDAFRVLGPLGGIGVFVGEQPSASDTEALYYVEDPVQVKELLHNFVKKVPGSPAKKPSPRLAPEPGVGGMNNQTLTKSTSAESLDKLLVPSLDKLAKQGKALLPGEKERRSSLLELTEMRSYDERF